MERLRQNVREFLHVPLETAVQWAVYLIMLGVALYILVVAVRWVLGFLGEAFR
jgi:hypothetical protein